jgi:hypothetical protein
MPVDCRSRRPEQAGTPLDAICSGAATFPAQSLRVVNLQPHTEVIRSHNTYARSTGSGGSTWPHRERDAHAEEDRSYNKASEGVDETTTGIARCAATHVEEVLTPDGEGRVAHSGHERHRQRAHPLGMACSRRQARTITAFPGPGAHNLHGMPGKRCPHLI